MRTVQLRDLCHVITKGTTPTTLGMKLNEGEVNFIKVESLSFDGQFIPEKIQKIDTATHETLKRSQLKEGDILYSIAGSIGRSVIVTEEILPANTNQAIALIRPNANLVETDYLFYYLRNQQSQDDAKRRIVQSVQTNLSLGELGNLDVTLPERVVQQDIARVMKDLDSKILKNREIAKTLSEVTQAIFKSWFVNFEPVFAKMAGVKPLGMNESVAELFPNTFDDSEFGPIPKGWFWGSLGDIADVIDCLHSKKPELLSEGFPYLQLDTISNEGVLFFDKAAFISAEDYKKWTSRIEVTGGDCLITNVGRVGAISQVPDSFKAAIGRNITALRPISLPLHKSFLIISLLSDFMKKEITKNTDSGTILEALNVKNIPKLRIPRPNDALLIEFARICDPIQAQIQTLYSMNIKLQSIRDSLLPRLVSGELKNPEITVAK